MLLGSTTLQCPLASLGMGLGLSPAPPLQCPPLRSPSPYLPPCPRWQKRHSCPVHWWGCGAGIRAAWAPPSLSLEKHSRVISWSVGAPGLRVSSARVQRGPDAIPASAPLLCQAFASVGQRLTVQQALEPLFRSLFSNGFISMNVIYSSTKIP